MKSLVTLAALASAVCITARQLPAEDYKLAALCTDQAGIETQLSSINFPAIDVEFFYTTPRLAIRADSYKIAVPLERLISIKLEALPTPSAAVKKKQASQSRFAVVFRSSEGEETVDGSLYLNQIAGKNDFGSFDLPVSKLKSLVFSEPPRIQSPKLTKEQEADAKQFAATIEMEDGSKLQLEDVRRHDEYYYSAPAPPGFYNTTSGPRHLDARNIILTRGESTMTVQFADLARIVFGKDREVTLALRTGQTTTGTLSKVDGAGIKGLNGTKRSLVYFIEVANIKEVHFGTDPR